MNVERNHDDMLFEMLKECKTLPMFFDEIFGFLQRKTDFYHVAAEECSPVGLPDGLAESIVRHTFFKWKPKDIVVKSADEIPVANEETVINDDTIPINQLTLQETSFSSSESYNGTICENYSWAQNISDVDIIVKIPESTTSKDLTVIIQPNHLSVKLKTGLILLEGDLCQKCKHNDAIWSLDKRKLEIHLDKCADVWWDCLLKNEENKLDVSKIDCSRPFEDLSEEAQAKIEELQWNQERRRLGLLTSDQEKLRMAWEAKGSPFSGPFDPTAVDFIN